jgi:filamentous hemagglutinin
MGAENVPRGAPDSLNITGKQFSKKLNRRANELGLDVSSAKDRFKFRSRIQRAFDNAEEVRSGTFRGQGPGGAEGPVNFFRRGEDVVVTTPDGDFVTFLPGGASNKRFLAGTPIP